MFEGFQLMVVGMTTVFVFLGLLVALMQASAAFFAAFADRFPDSDSKGVAAPAGAPAEEEVAIAIALAEAARRGRGI